MRCRFLLTFKPLHLGGADSDKRTGPEALQLPITDELAN